MSGSNQSIMARDIVDIWRDIVAWCARKGVQNWLTGFSIFVTIILGGMAIYKAYQGATQLDTALKSWRYLSFAILVPISQFLSWVFGVASKGQLDKIASENNQLRGRLSKVGLIEQNMESIFGVWLNLILGEVKMDGDCRASFYVWDDKGSDGNEFVYLARESNDAKLKKKGRDRFPGDQGVISVAWRAKDGIASYFAASCIRTDDDVVKDMVDRYAFSLVVANALTMKSKVILGHVISGRYGKVGVVIVESLQGVTKRDKRNAYLKRCSDVVKKVTPHITRLFEIYSNSMFKQEDPMEEP